MMDVYVQSFLNSATKLAFTVTNATTVADLKTAIYNREGTTTTIMELYYDTTVMVNTQTMAFYSISSGSYIQTSNTIAALPTKEARQIAKLDLAKLRRKAGGNTSADYYRDANDYNRDLLAAKYIGNTATNISNTLTEQRPWI
jgi:hypothetical protein